MDPTLRYIGKLRVLYAEKYNWWKEERDNVEAKGKKE